MKGCTLRGVLAAGQWKSAAFMGYVPKQELVCGAVKETHIADSDSDWWAVPGQGSLRARMVMKVFWGSAFLMWGRPFLLCFALESLVVLHLPTFASRT